MKDLLKHVQQFYGDLDAIVRLPGSLDRSLTPPAVLDVYRKLYAAATQAIPDDPIAKAAISGVQEPDTLHGVMVMTGQLVQVLKRALERP